MASLKSVVFIRQKYNEYVACVKLAKAVPVSSKDAEHLCGPAQLRAADSCPAEWVRKRKFVKLESLLSSHSLI
jgi:hypothetical protein